VDKSAIKIELGIQFLLKGKLAKQLLLINTVLMNKNKIKATTAVSFEHEWMRNILLKLKQNYSFQSFV